MLQGVLIDQALEMLFECAGHFWPVDPVEGGVPGLGAPLNAQSDAPICARQNT